VQEVSFTFLYLTSNSSICSTLFQGFTDLINENFTHVRSLVILFGHWVMHCYGIVSLTQLTDPSLHLPLLLLVFFPVVFYISTTKFTNSENLDKIE